MSWKHEWAAGAFLITVLTICALIGWGGHQRQLRQEAEAKLLASDLELAGAKAALTVKPKEIIKFVEVPAAVKAAVKSGAVAPIAGIKGTAKSNVVEVPCPEPKRVEFHDNEVIPDKEVNVTSTAPVWFEVKGNLFLGQIKHGAAMWTGTLDGMVHSGEFKAPIEFDPEHIDLQVKVSDELAKAADYYGRSWIKKHTAFACPIAGLSYDPFTQKVAPSIGCGVGFVWF